MQGLIYWSSPRGCAGVLGEDEDDYVAAAWCCWHSYRLYSSDTARLGRVPTVSMSKCVCWGGGGGEQVLRGQWSFWVWDRGRIVCVCVCVCVCEWLWELGWRAAGQLAASGSSVPRGYPAWRKFAPPRQLGAGCQPRHSSRNKCMHTAGGHAGSDGRQEMGCSFRKKGRRRVEVEVVLRRIWIRPGSGC